MIGILKDLITWPTSFKSKEGPYEQLKHCITNLSIYLKSKLKQEIMDNKMIHNRLLDTYLKKILELEEQLNHIKPFHLKIVEGITIDCPSFYFDKIYIDQSLIYKLNNLALVPMILNKYSVSEKSVSKNCIHKHLMIISVLSN